MNKLIMTPIALTLMTFSLAGCGEGEDAIFGSGSSNELKVISFEKVTNGTTDAVARIEQTYRTGEHKAVTRSIFNNYNGQEPNTANKIVLANNFEGKLENKDIRVNERTVKRPISEKNSDTKRAYQTTYEAYRLQGYTANDYIYNADITKRRGIFTDLNKYLNINKNISFPSGSICYIPVTTSDIKFWSFDENSPNYNYKTLDNWVDAIQQRFIDNRNSSVSTIPVGYNDNYKAAQVKFFAVKNEPEYLYSGVEYKNNVYDATYLDIDMPKPNTDKNTGVVDCTLVNDIAADFLAKQIVDSYRR